MGQGKIDEAANTPRTWCPDDFAAPPVVSRHFLVRLDISKEDFEQRATALVDTIQRKGNFDQRGLNAQWDFRLEVQGTAPKPRVLLTHIPLLTRSAKDHMPRTLLEFYPPIEGNQAQLHISQDRTDLAASRYEDLEREISASLPLVMEHFGVARVGGFVLEYRNLIDRERYPMFWEGEKTLQLERLLWLFRNYPGPGNFVTPFSVEFNSASPLSWPGNVRFHMETVQNGREEFALQIMLAYNSFARMEKRAADDLFAELAGAHHLLFENFIRQFSPVALEAFTR